MADEVVVALTGGPCGGKSSVLSAAAQKIPTFGWDLYPIKESATELIEQGMRLKDAVASGNERRVIECQHEIIGHAWDNLRRMRRIAAREGRKALLLTDRGLPDTLAYLPKGERGREMYAHILKEETGLDPAEAMDLYKAVIKFTTAADGREEFYTLANNKARDEAPPIARRLDKRIEEAYLGHPHFRVIGNFEEGVPIDFERKKSKGFREICAVLGIPAPYEVERKFLIEEPNFVQFPVAYRTVEIEQIYLHGAMEGEAADTETRVRKRTFKGFPTHYLTRKRAAGFGTRIETEEIISAREYALLSKLRDPRRGIVRKHRTCFLWEGQYFELDTFLSPRDLWILEIELTDIHQRVELPRFIRVKKDVTGDPEYSNHEIALRVQ